MSSTLDPLRAKLESGDIAGLLPSECSFLRSLVDRETTQSLSIFLGDAIAHTLFATGAATDDLNGKVKAAYAQIVADIRGNRPSVTTNDSRRVMRAVMAWAVERLAGK
jgi:hypothetical protein